MGSTAAAAAVVDRSYDLAVIDHWASAPRPGRRPGGAPPTQGGSRSSRPRGPQPRRTIWPGPGHRRPPARCRARGDLAVRAPWPLVPGSRERTAGRSCCRSAAPLGVRRPARAGLRSGHRCWPRPPARRTRGRAHHHQRPAALPQIHHTILALTRATASNGPAVSTCLRAARLALGRPCPHPGVARDSSGERASHVTDRRRRPR